MPSIIEHLRRRQEPQPLGQGILVPARNFTPRYGGFFDAVFGDSVERYLTRGDVFDAFAQNDQIGCTTAIAWGFPRGGRPGGRSLTPALEAIPHFLLTLRAIRQGGLDGQTYDTINALPGVKNGITTKVLYFAGTRSVTGAPALIYDSRVQTHLLARNWDEYIPLTRTLRRSALAPTAAQYLQYLEITDYVARELRWDAAAIEMHMFSDAPGRRPPAHR
ncbi:8-oxoguanine DNA glycosylase OGG fold protein [Burkholderia vietnamiensis]|uniref:8-oxoguanine DNA glycosylase OGG fold protein n=1 Tax=Burkholderia vietnamiensis TaxID=60552 RepID=UPI001D136CEB|nr:hypothetical protein [Burkholderia vietnamiensis]UEC01744.1 hypothetical protein LK462_06875 [Burkholderia vietnamiensis]